jgi:predicted HTH transcriptional regulator
MTILDNTNLTFDQLPCSGVEFEALDPNRLKWFLEKIGRPQDDLASLRTLGVISPVSEMNMPSNGGIILFGKDEVRNHYFADTHISCARFKGVDKVSFIDRQEMGGSPIEALEDVLKFIARHTSMGGMIRSLVREDIPEFPPIAVREVLLNAIVHGNYALSGRVMVAIFDDRLEIQSPGMLPYGMTLEHFKESSRNTFPFCRRFLSHLRRHFCASGTHVGWAMLAFRFSKWLAPDSKIPRKTGSYFSSFPKSGISHIRNRVIARVFRELGLIEEWGSGYRRIVSYCNEQGYPLPQWEEFGVAVRVTFRRHKFFEDAVETPVSGNATKKSLSRHLMGFFIQVLRG